MTLKKAFTERFRWQLSAVRHLLWNTDRGLGTLAVSIATPMIVDKTKLAGDGRLDEHCGAFVTHTAMHKHDRLPRSFCPRFPVPRH
jgi:hypothetical protein